MNKYLITFSVIAILVLYAVSSLIHSKKIAANIEQQKLLILNRVSLDLHWLLIKESYFEDKIDGYPIAKYIAKLNHHLTQFNSRVKVNSIRTYNESEAVGNSNTQLKMPFKNALVTFDLNHEHSKYSYIVPLVFTLVNGILFYFAMHKYQRQTLLRRPKRLVLDLYSKSIMLSSNKSKKYPLANKPFCFYIALIEFCEQYPEIKLNQHAQVPQELVVTANKYFLRLIELGHPVRRQPDFSNCSDKTLFEIRAALDALITDDLKFKWRVYPPKLQGRGDKLPSYSIPNIKHSDFEVVGK